MKLLKYDNQGYTFFDILLDETLCKGTIKIPAELVSNAGGINEQLKAGRKYELILRIAQQCPVIFEDVQEENEIGTNFFVLKDDEAQTKADFGWKTDCYVAGKYSQELQNAGIFDAVVTSVLNDAMQWQRYDETLSWLEKMLAKQAEFLEINRMTCPVLIYKGDDACYNVLTVFAEQFGMALERAGKQVIYFDVSSEKLENVTRYMHKQFYAVIGVQSYMFSIKMQDEQHYLHEYIHGPKYNFIFDHPIWMKNHLEHHLQDFCVLTHDMNYVNYVKKYFGYEAELFPPAGMTSKSLTNCEKEYDLTFVGTYFDYRRHAQTIRQMERKKRFFANHLLRVLRQNTELSSEAAFNRVVEERKMVFTREEYLEWFYDMRWVFFCVTHYYREKVLYAILNGGIRMDVYGDSWNSSPFKKYPNLICHPDITVEESLTVWKKSKLALNIMSWHKGGFTERMANIMLSGAVLVTDDTTYLHGKYDQEDMLIFHLQELDTLVERIKELLANDAGRNRIAENGKKKAEQEHTWDKRAEQFLKLNSVDFFE